MVQSHKRCAPVTKVYTVVRLEQGLENDGRKGSLRFVDRSRALLTRYDTTTTLALCALLPSMLLLIHTSGHV